MAVNLYASFADATLAERAAGALLDHGVSPQDITVIANAVTDRPSAVDPLTGAVAPEVGLPASAPPPSTLAPLAPADAEALEVTPAVAPLLDTGGDTVIYASDPLGDRVAQAGDRAAAEAVTASTQSTPEALRAARAARLAAEAHAAKLSEAAAAPAVVRGGGLSAGHDPEFAAKGGVTITTPADAAEGAGKGAAVGLGLGIAAGLASIAIPGFGLVIGGGALALAIGGMAAATAAGAIAGGVIGSLVDQGVPEEAARSFASAVQHGGAVVAVHLPSGSVGWGEAEQLLNKYGAVEIAPYGS